MMETDLYTAEDFTVELPAADYVARFNDSERFLECCKACGNYGKLWACPPFDHDPLGALRPYRRVMLTATKIVPRRKGVPLSRAKQFIRPERLRIERQMLELERATGGRALAFAGSCLHCPEGTCTRGSGRPCRHPALVRPSLEACGFDLGATAAELFGFPLLWSADGNLPDYLTLICGLFHNCDKLPELP